MNTPETSKVSYRAALSIFGAIVAIAVMVGLLPARLVNAANTEKAPVVKKETSRGLNLKDWVALAK